MAPIFWPSQPHNLTVCETAHFTSITEATSDASALDLIQVFNRRSDLATHQYRCDVAHGLRFVQAVFSHDLCGQVFIALKGAQLILREFAPSRTDIIQD
jgi:hypothetical protein